MRTDLIWHLKHNHVSLSIGGWWSEEISEYLLSLVRGVVHRAKIASIIHPPDHGGEQLALLRSVETEHPLAHGNSSSDLIAHSEAGLGDLGHHHAALSEQGDVPVMYPPVSSLVFTAEVGDALVGHEGSENFSELAQFVNQLAVELDVLPASSHGAAEIYQHLAGRHDGLQLQG